MNNSLLQELQHKLDNTEDFLERMEIMGELEDLKIKLGLKLPPKPLESPYTCEGCSG